MNKLVIIEHLEGLDGSIEPADANRRELCAFLAKRMWEDLE